MKVEEPKREAEPQQEEGDGICFFAVDIYVSNGETRKICGHEHVHTCCTKHDPMYVAILNN